MSTKRRYPRSQVARRLAVPFSLALLVGVMGQPAELRGVVISEDDKLIVANPGSDLSEELIGTAIGAIVTLDGLASYSLEGPIATYCWRIDGEEIANTAKPKVTLGLGFHVIELYVTDELGNSDTDCVTIELYKEGIGTPLGNNGATGTPDQHVIAVAGPDQKLAMSAGRTTAKVQLDASLSFSNPLGQQLFYSWKERDANIATGATPVVELAEGYHPILLEVRNEEGALHGDSVMVTISACQDCGFCGGMAGMVLVVGLTAIGGLRMGVRRLGRRAHRRPGRPTRSLPSSP